MQTQSLPYRYLFKGLAAVQNLVSKELLLEVNDKSKQVNIPFNKPFMTGYEQTYVNDVLATAKLSGDGYFTKKCEELFEATYNVNKCFLTSSCSDALEMSAVLLELQEGDEVIMPSYTFVSSANAFIMHGANVVFADSNTDHPGIDEDGIESLITPKTKAIVVVHYAGAATNMDKIMAIADKHGLYVIEDAAQAVDAYYKGKALGTIGHMGTISFHETKNIISGEGGMLLVNDERFIERAEIIREKGTDRTKFMRGEIDKYGWVDVGSSYLPNEMTAAFLYAQLENIEYIQSLRMKVWNTYYEELKELEVMGWAKLPSIIEGAEHNGHIFYLVLPDEYTQNSLRGFLKEMGISAVFHYTPLHNSKYYADKHDGRELENCDKYGNCLLRLPMYAGMTATEQKIVIQKVWRYFLDK